MQTENSSLSISLFTSQVDLTELSRGCLDERSRREVSGAASYLGDPNLASRFCPAWCFVDLDGENHNARRTIVPTLDRKLTTNIVAAYVRRNQIGAADQLLVLISTVHQVLAHLRKSKAKAFHKQAAV